MSTLATRIGPADHGRAMTLEEFQDADEEPGYRYELARGVLEVTHVPSDPHGEVVYHLYRALARHDLAQPGVIKRSGGAAEFRLWLPGMVSGRNPDVAVVLRNTPRDHRGHRPPVLAFEVVSKGGQARDYQVKREEYLAFGLREYWIVDPLIRRVTVLIRDGDAWIERVFQGEQAAEGLVLPGFTLPLAELWPEEEPGDDSLEAHD
jgi:Uma2 family endonuclease